MSYFVLEAFEYVHPDHASEYERRSAGVQAQVKEIEPDMLVHLQMRVAETADEVTYRWMEVFRRYEGLEAHLLGAHVKEHHAYLSGGVLTRPSDVKIYADWTEARKDEWRARIPGIEFVPAVNAFYRAG